MQSVRQGEGDTLRHKSQTLFVLFQHVEDLEDGGMVQLTQGTDVLGEGEREGGREGGKQR